ncbi:MAG: class I SAM-dependent methyltransferase [Candidatus Poseidoniaceae archaeon]|jgi:SAM-dependent methyltransferase|nr:class I SAM-dependent methyltransferase [Candidatus Poseidoniaceae archaeon]
MDEDIVEIREKLISLSKNVADDEQPLGWFEELYSRAERNSMLIPWATLEANPVMLRWLEKHNINGKVLIVGCGLGDDAIGLEKLGWEVTAFDISSACINWCRERFPKSNVDWQVADLLNPPNDWMGKFDLVVEIHILQAIPDGGIRESGASMLPKLLNQGGHLLCIGRLDDGQELEMEPPPWPLKESWLDGQFHELEKIDFELFTKPESPETPRFVSSWAKI